MKQIYTIHLLIKASSKMKCNELERTKDCLFLCVFKSKDALSNYLEQACIDKYLLYIFIIYFRKL